MYHDQGLAPLNNARNTSKSPYAKESSRMNFKTFDLAPEDELNRILLYTA